MPKPLMSFQYTNPLRSYLGDSFFSDLPRIPAVYFMLDHEGTVLYIGKAKDLRARLNTYKNMKPGTAPDYTIEMLESVREIKWEEHPNEKAALTREHELLHAMRPPYNIADTEPGLYLFLGYKIEPSSRQGMFNIHFNLCSRRRDPSYQYFGCFKHRYKVKSGFGALLRLLHAAMNDKNRFSLPARICRVSPPYQYSSRMPAIWITLLEKFLSGSSKAFLEVLFERMLENETIPAFAYAPLQRDFEMVADFFRLGPVATRKHLREQGGRSKILTHEQMDTLISMTSGHKVTENVTLIENYNSRQT